MADGDKGGVSLVIGLGGPKASGSGGTDGHGAGSGDDYLRVMGQAVKDALNSGDPQRIGEAIRDAVRACHAEDDAGETEPKSDRSGSGSDRVASLFGKGPTSDIGSKSRGY